MNDHKTSGHTLEVRSRQMDQPKVKLAELREYVSQSGKTYFAGFMGKTRLVLLKDTRAECTGKEIGRWNLLIEEAPPSEERRPAASHSTGSALPASTGSHQPTRAHRKPSDSRAGQSLRDQGI